MNRASNNQSQPRLKKASPLDWPALALFFLLATAFWIPPLPHSLWSMSAILRVLWLTLLLAASTAVLFRRHKADG